MGFSTLPRGLIERGGGLSLKTSYLAHWPQSRVDLTRQHSLRLVGGKKRQSCRGSSEAGYWDSQSKQLISGTGRDLCLVVELRVRGGAWCVEGPQLNNGDLFASFSEPLIDYQSWISNRKT